MAQFQPGDVVVCVDAASPNRDGRIPRELSVGMVDRVMSTHVGVKGDPGVVLMRTKPAEPHLRGFKAWRFRKIDDETTEEFREQMRSLGKVRERTDA